METSQKNRFIFLCGKLSVKSFTFLICDTLSIKQIKKQLLNYINKSNILHNYVQNDFLAASFISRVQFSINMFIIYDKGELNIILSSMIFASTVSSHSYCTAKINLFFKKNFLFYLWSDWYPLSLLSITHQLWHSCLEVNRLLLPPQPPYTNGLHSPERGWKYHSRT